MSSIDFILLAWIPLSLMMFWFLPARRAVLVCVLGGWALLPTEDYGDPAAPAFRTLPLALPSHLFLTKSVVIGIALIVGAALFDRQRLARWRFRWPDAVMLLWCITPLLTAAAHAGSFSDASRNTAYLALSWGAPYFAGRLCFAEAESLDDLARAWVIAALAYVPITLIEVITGPRWYAALYGFHPFAAVGAERYVGYRPLGFLEDGNQFGMWLASAAAAAWALWRAAPSRRLAGLPAWVAAMILVIATCAAQSVGAIALLAIGIAVLEVAFWRPQMLRWCALAGGLVLGLLALTLLTGWSARSWSRNSHLGRWVVGLLRATGRLSLAWRRAKDEGHIHAALAHPWLGTGKWDWWGGGIERPWGFWLLVGGMYGAVGMLLAYSSLLGGMLRISGGLVFHPLKRSDNVARATSLVLGVVLWMTAADSLLNGAIVLPVLLASGALAGAGVKTRIEPQGGRIPK